VFSHMSLCFTGKGKLFLLLICSKFCFNVNMWSHIRYADVSNKIVPSLALGIQAITLLFLIHAMYVYRHPFEKLADGAYLFNRTVTTNECLRIARFVILVEHMKHTGPGKPLPSPVGSAGVDMELGVTCFSFTAQDVTTFVVGVDGGGLLHCSTIAAKPAPGCWCYQIFHYINTYIHTVTNINEYCTSTVDYKMYPDIRGKILGKHSVRLRNGYTFQAACSLYFGRYSMVQKSLDTRSNNIWGDFWLLYIVVTNYEERSI